MKEKIKIVLVDDNKSFIEAVKAIFSFRDDLEVVGEAYDGFQFLELLKTCSPNVVLMDINMPNMDGILATKKGLIEDANMKVIGVTMADNVDIHLNMLHFGFAAGIQKDRFTEQFDEALHAALTSQVFFPVLI
ncbi:MAG: response regulator transcription factor [Prolixibacteraceae bacterium]